MDLSCNSQPAKVITHCSCEEVPVSFLPWVCPLNLKTQTFVYPWLELVDTDLKSKGELGLSGGGSETLLAVMADIMLKQRMKIG